MGLGALSVWIAFLMGPSAELFGRSHPPATTARSARSGPLIFIAPPQETTGSIKPLRPCHVLRPDIFVVRAGQIWRPSGRSPRGAGRGTPLAMPRGSTGNRESED